MRIHLLYLAKWVLEMSTQRARLLGTSASGEVACSMWWLWEHSLVEHNGYSYLVSQCVPLRANPLACLP